MSASSKTTTGALPPSSRWVRLADFDAACDAFLAAETTKWGKVIRDAGVTLD